MSKSRYFDLKNARIWQIELLAGETTLRNKTDEQSQQTPKGEQIYESLLDDGQSICLAR